MPFFCLEAASPVNTCMCASVHVCMRTCLRARMCAYVRACMCSRSSVHAKRHGMYDVRSPTGCRGCTNHPQHSAHDADAMVNNMGFVHSARTRARTHDARMHSCRVRALTSLDPATRSVENRSTMRSSRTDLPCLDPTLRVPASDGFERPHKKTDSC